MKYIFIVYLFTNTSVNIIDIFLVKLIYKKVWLFQKQDVHLFVGRE
jgi:hypothetical protein